MMTVPPPAAQADPARGALHAGDLMDVTANLHAVAGHLKLRIAAGGPYHATNDGLVDELVRLADDLLALAACMTSEAFIHVLDRVSVLPGGKGRPVRFG